MIKIEICTHIDGFAAQVAETVIVGGAKAEGRQADAIKAAHTAIEGALRLMRPGGTNTQVSVAVQNVAKAFGCKLVEGSLSHQIEQNELDGAKAIYFNTPDSQKKEVEEVILSSCLPP